MGHYDSAYEYEDNQFLHKRNLEMAEGMQKCGELAASLLLQLRDLPGEVPNRFEDSLEDLMNWLTINSPDNEVVTGHLLSDD